MANDLNNCTFIGRLGRDPEVKAMQSGKNVCNFSLAVGSSWKDKSGEKQESTEWVNCVVYDKLADICEQYLTKGSQIYVAGKMKTEKYTGKDGSEKYATKIVLSDMQMLGGKQSTDSAKPTKASKGGSGFNDMDSDIPF